MLTADDVLAHRFAQTQFRPGYREPDVDEFLDLVVDTLRARASGATEVLTSDDMRSRSFATTQLQAGYEPDEVDALLRAAADALDAMPHSTAAPESTAGQEARGRRKLTPRAIGGLVLADVVGVPPDQRHPRAPRARRVAAARVTVDVSGIAWRSWTGRTGFVAAASIAEIALVEVTLLSMRTRGEIRRFGLVLDRQGAVLLRVGEGARLKPAGAPFERWLRGAWDELGVPVKRHGAIFDRPKDRRRTWPEAFSFLYAYPYLSGVTALTVSMVVGALLDRSS